MNFANLLGFIFGLCCFGIILVFSPFVLSKILFGSDVFDRRSGCLGIFICLFLGFCGCILLSSSSNVMVNARTNIERPTHFTISHANGGFHNGLSDIKISKLSNVKSLPKNDETNVSGGIINDFF